jgi:AraC-like DNA-binding protein
MSAVRTHRMAARASTDNLMLFCVYMAGRGRIRQHDRFAELAAGTGVLTEARSGYERTSSTDTRRLTLRFSREVLPLRPAEITEGCARSMDPAAPAMQMLSACGFVDLRTFERAFRRRYGMARGSWRRERATQDPLRDPGWELPPR